MISSALYSAWLAQNFWPNSDVIKAPSVQPSFVDFFGSAQPYSINFGPNYISKNSLSAAALFQSLGHKKGICVESVRKRFSVCRKKNFSSYFFSFFFYFSNSRSASSDPFSWSGAATVGRKSVDRLPACQRYLLKLKHQCFPTLDDSIKISRDPWLVSRWLLGECRSSLRTISKAGKAISTCQDCKEELAYF